MDKPYVTIGIPAYNEERYLRKTIESALGQTYRNIKIIISNNLSNDSTGQIAEDFARLDNRVSVIHQPSHVNVEQNFRSLLNIADTEYFVWLGGHDIISSVYIEEALSLFKLNNNTAAVYPNAVSYDAEGKMFSVTDDFYIEGNDFFNQVIKIVKTCSNGSAFHSVFKTDYLRKSFLDINGGDLFLFLRVAMHGKFIPAQQISYTMRNVKSSESDKERDARYIAYGFKPNWREIHSMYPFTVIAEYNGLSLFKKLNLFIIVRDLMVKYRDNSWATVTLYFLKQAKLKCSLLAFLAGIKSVIRK